MEAVGIVLDVWKEEGEQLLSYSLKNQRWSSVQHSSQGLGFFGGLCSVEAVLEMGELEVLAL